MFPAKSTVKSGRTLERPDGIHGFGFIWWFLVGPVRRLGPALVNFD
jgi:hypothetical protein